MWNSRHLSFIRDKREGGRGKRWDGEEEWERKEKKRRDERERKNGIAGKRGRDWRGTGRKEEGPDGRGMVDERRKEDY